MLFNSIAFAVFFSVVLILYPRLKLKAQNAFLLLASYVFYGYWDWRFTGLIFASTVLDFFVGRGIHKTEIARRQKALLALSLAGNLGILGFFKYFNFFVESAAWALSDFGLQPNIHFLNVVLPVGISFYTFQTLSYTIDIYRKKIDPTRSFLDFALFVSFFPQLVAGPIERAKNLLPQISKPRTMTQARTYSGLCLMLLGYFKKVAIADTLAPLVDAVFSAPSALSAGELWSGVIGFAFQIYGDFSGYSNIARGISRILGFELMENFNAPYLSRTITEFWRRWHVSLSSWLRDYLYISLGGNRRGKVRTYLNLMITMVLGGLWHGASWQFCIWGAMHGFYLSVHRLLLRGRKPEPLWPTNRISRVIEILKIFCTFLLVSLTWIFFRSERLTDAVTYIQGLLRFDGLRNLSPIVFVAAGAMIVLDVVQTATRSHTWLLERPLSLVLRLGIVEILVVSVVTAAIAHAGTLTPFIYFQF